MIDCVKSGRQIQFSLSPVCEPGPMCLVLMANPIINWSFFYIYIYISIGSGTV